MVYVYQRSECLDLISMRISPLQAYDPIYDRPLGRVESVRLSVRGKINKPRGQSRYRTAAARC